MPLIRLENFQQFAAINVTSDPGHDPSSLTIPSCVQVRLDWAMDDGRIAHNITHCRYSAGFTPTTTIANAILASLTSGASWSGLAAFLSTSTALGAVVLRDLNSPNQPLVPSNTGGSLGTSASPALPNEVAAVITTRTALTGPQNRGRLFVPGWATNALGAGNVIATAAQSALQAWASGDLFTALNSQGLTWAIGHFHRVSYTGSTGRLHPERPAETVIITSAVVRDNHWDSQRKRGLR